MEDPSQLREENSRLKNEMAIVKIMFEADLRAKKEQLSELWARIPPPVFPHQPPTVVTPPTSSLSASRPSSFAANIQDEDNVTDLQTKNRQHGSASSRPTPSQQPARTGEPFRALTATQQSQQSMRAKVAAPTFVPPQSTVPQKRTIASVVGVSAEDEIAVSTPKTRKRKVKVGQPSGASTPVAVDDVWRSLGVWDEGANTFRPSSWLSPTVKKAIEPSLKAFQTEEDCKRLAHVSSGKKTFCEHLRQGHRPSLDLRANFFTCEDCILRKRVCIIVPPGRSAMIVPRPPHERDEDLQPTDAAFWVPP